MGIKTQSDVNLCIFHDYLCVFPPNGLVLLSPWTEKVCADEPCYFAFIANHPVSPTDIQIIIFMLWNMAMAEIIIVVKHNSLCFSHFTGPQTFLWVHHHRDKSCVLLQQLIRSRLFHPWKSLYRYFRRFLSSHSFVVSIHAFLQVQRFCWITFFSPPSAMLFKVRYIRWPLPRQGGKRSPTEVLISKTSILTSIRKYRILSSSALRWIRPLQLPLF